MTAETMNAVRAVVNTHKLQAQINQAFADFLQDTNTSPLDYTEKDRLLFQLLACAKGYHMGLSKAQELNDQAHANIRAAL